MIHTAKYACFFNGHQVARLFHHADKTFVAPSIATDNAGIGFGKGKTSGAETNGGMEFCQAF